ncbi:hypothetical protein [Streptomyces sp. NPDC127020]|uniref:hypothetical protein n=1 Tax=Streptomyces sp. NPDC127020 TaxID=3347109 RepID=UPI0036539A43
MATDTLTVETPAGPVRATSNRQDDAVVFELSGAMRGHVHVTGTTHPQHWDRFTAVRACLGPFDGYRTTAPDDALPRLAHGHSGYRGSLRLHPGALAFDVSVSPLETAAGNTPAPLTAVTLTAVMRACAEHVVGRGDLPAILTASRQRDTPGLLRFLHWSAGHHRGEAARLEEEARAAHAARRAAVTAWWIAARCFAASPPLVLGQVLADYPGSLARQIDVMQWLEPYCVTAADHERDLARRAVSESVSLRAQQRQRPLGRDLPRS